MSRHSTSPPILSSMADIAGDTDAWICDVWGVLHNGAAPYPEAAEACRRFRERGGTVVLVTNAPYPASDVERRLKRLGIENDVWDEIVTSGDTTRALIDALGPQPLMHLGPDRMLGIFEGIEDRLVAAEDAKLVICTGLYDDERESPESYRSMLGQFADRKIPLICANPDIMVERGERLLPCAGALAEIYAEIGGEVRYTGKPHPPIYERAFETIARHRGTLPPKDRLLAIGDGLRTDIAGAGRNGLKCLYIASALHVADGREVDDALMAELFEDIETPPIAAMKRLAW